MGPKADHAGIVVSFWTGKNVLVTGAGFLGRNVVKVLGDRGAGLVVVPHSADYDLRGKEACRRFVRDATPKVVIPLAARVGGIGANTKNPGQFFYENALMCIELMEASRRVGVEKFVVVGTICSYPRITPIPFREEDLWKGYTDEAGGPYGMAKKMLLVRSKAYRQGYGFNSIHLLPVNLYGPDDNFDPESSHVLPSLGRKFVEAHKAGKTEVVLWGTGAASREFLHVADAARGIVLAAERYNLSDPINLGSGRETPIKELAAIVAGAVGYRGSLVWDSSKPDGQPRRCVHTSGALREF